MSTFAEQHHRQPKRPNQHPAPVHLPPSAAPVAAPHGLAGPKASAALAAPLMSHWADVGPPATAHKTDPGFEKLLGAELHETDAPSQIALPEVLRAALATAWTKSIASPDVKEHGGNFVRNGDGSFAFREGGTGTDEGFQPDASDVGADQKLVGYAHTHPYSKDDGGHTDVSFSKYDLAAVVLNGDMLTIARSGETQFVVARSAEFNERLARLTYAQTLALMEQMKAMWQSVHDTTPGELPQKAEAATAATCRAFHLLYYRGKGSLLNQVGPANPSQR